MVEFKTSPLELNRKDFFMFSQLPDCVTVTHHTVTEWIQIFGDCVARFIYRSPQHGIVKCDVVVSVHLAMSHQKIMKRWKNSVV